MKFKVYDLVWVKNEFLDKPIFARVITVDETRKLYMIAQGTDFVAMATAFEHECKPYAGESMVYNATSGYLEKV